MVCFIHALLKPELLLEIQKFLQNKVKHEMVFSCWKRALEFLLRDEMLKLTGCFFFLPLSIL